METEKWDLEEGWSKIYPAIEDLVQRLWPEGQEWERVKITNTEYMTVFTLVYNMCVQKPPHNYSDQLYGRYMDTINQVFNQNVLPKTDSASKDDMRFVVNDQWSRFCIFVKWISAYFSYLDRFHTSRMGMPTLYEMGIGVFKDNLRQHLTEEITKEITKEITEEITETKTMKMIRSEQIAEDAFNAGRNPLDTAGMDTDDEVWLSKNQDYEDYIMEVWSNKKKIIG
jgi:cullin 1